MRAGGAARRNDVRIGQRRSASLAIVGLIGLAALTGCAGSGSSSNPAHFGETSDFPDTGQAGTGRAGDILVPKGTYAPIGHGVSVHLDIDNTGAAPDQLVRVTSNVSGQAALTPDPIPIPAHATVHVGTGPVRITLPVTVKLDPGETLALTLSFAKSGHVLVYALTTS